VLPLINRTNIGKSFISKYEGLRRIEKYNLPHPSWRFIANYKDIPSVAWTEAPYGWTIRCCPREKYEFGLPSKHRLNYKQLPSTLQELHNKANVSQFVIYPSWEFDFSGCILITSDSAFIEVVMGDIKALLKGQRTPDSIYFCEKPNYSQLALRAGKEGILSHNEELFFLKVCRKVSTHEFIVLEWTKTTGGEILFHDYVEFRQLKQATRN
jgi:hypothetical protein